jgi:hypothetical protein
MKIANENTGGSKNRPDLTADRKENWRAARTGDRETKIGVKKLQTGSGTGKSNSE